MPFYSCDKCNFFTESKYNYKRHLNTKKHKNNEKNSKETLPKNVLKYTMSTNEHKMSTNEHKMSTNEHTFFECQYCNMNFSSKAIMRRHQNYYCKEIEDSNPKIAIKRLKQKMEKDKIKMREKFEKEKDKLYNQIDKLIDKAGDTNTTINNIQLNNFGEEDTSYISDKILERLIVYPGSMIPNLVQLTYFHKDHPENKTIKITNKKDKYIKIYKDDEWKLDKRDNVIDNIMNNKLDTLETYYEEKGKNCITSYQKKRFEKIQDDFDCDNEKVINKIKDDIELTIMNNT